MDKFMKNYDFVEGAEFDALMPKAAEKIGVIGNADVVVPFMGVEAKGADALEVVDIEKAFE